VVRFEVNGTLDIHVHDNGKGFAENNPEGNGMGNMAKRMQDIGGQMAVVNNGGAHLVFSVPIEPAAPLVAALKPPSFVQKLQQLKP
jgi:signal transduction histidine kinase